MCHSSARNGEKVSLIRQDPQITESRIWNRPVLLEKSLSPLLRVPMASPHLCSVTESKWLCFFPDYTALLCHFLPSPLPHSKILTGVFLCSFLPPTFENIPISIRDFRSNSACSHSTSLWGGKCGQMSGRKMPFGKLFDLLHSIES